MKRSELQPAPASAISVRNLASHYHRHRCASRRLPAGSGARQPLRAGGHNALANRRCSKALMGFVHPSKSRHHHQWRRCGRARRSRPCYVAQMGAWIELPEVNVGATW